MTNELPENVSICDFCGERSNDDKETVFNEQNTPLHRKCQKQIQQRLEYLRGEIEAERMSYGELAELQGLADYIEPGDTVLLEWAGVPEGE